VTASATAIATSATAASAAARTPIDAVTVLP
jgi:hypothetical protein